MKMKVTLVLIGVFLSEALALTCLQCSVTTNGPCQSTQNCLGMCGMSALYTQDDLISYSAQCTPKEKCVSGNMSTAVTNYTISTGCCDSDNCIPNPTVQSRPPSGKQCYSCSNSNKNCSTTVKCSEGQDRCIRTKVVLGNSSMTVSGCASKSFCDKTPFLLSSVLRTNFTEITCCQGNLCNSAGDVKMSLLTMQLFLLSSIFFL
ncbi:urokinase plasminogen activator surface receptor-like [Colossoma macropomum]|uniref:urokinase plasminogen activator surface receptor-like n=1 Tax=Colossoma macropomum TaxID=42526 RepID=UPI0018646A2A|nr:urokinase plasminogen activator surface receptor-like [Colossoma macropomum]